MTMTENKTQKEVYPKNKALADLVGRWVRVYHKDSGCSDGIVLSASDTNDTFEWFGRDGNGWYKSSRESIVAIGPYVEVPLFE